MDEIEIIGKSIQEMVSISREMLEELKKTRELTERMDHTMRELRVRITEKLG